MGFSKPNVKKLTQRKDVEGLIKALTDKDWGVRGEAAEALGEIKDARAVEPLIQALKDIGVEAAEALINIGDERAVDSLIQYLEGADEAYRLRAQHLFEGMGKIPDKFDAVYRASITEEIHYEGRDVEELIAKLCAVAIPRTSIITESLVTSEYKHLSEAWAGITLRRGTLEELSDAIRPRLQRDSKSKGFDGFQLITYYAQKCSQVESFYVSTFRGYRVWRTKEALFASFWME